MAGESEFRIPVISSESARQEYMRWLDTVPAGKIYWIPYRMFYPVYRKGDGVRAWIASKWWDLRERHTGELLTKGETVNLTFGNNI